MIRIQVQLYISKVDIVLRCAVKDRLDYVLTESVEAVSGAAIHAVHCRLDLCRLSQNAALSSNSFLRTSGSQHFVLHATQQSLQSAELRQPVLAALTDTRELDLWTLRRERTNIPNS